MNPLSNEVLEHVNAEDSIIVLYDWEGNTAGPACALLSEKGVENVMLLHGGEQLLSDAQVQTTSVHRSGQSLLARSQEYRTRSSNGHEAGMPCRSKGFCWEAS